MKVTELMLNDWVQFVEGKSMTIWDNRTKFQISCIPSLERVGAKDSGCWSGSNIPVGCIKPIKINETILSYNGFEFLHETEIQNTFIRSYRYGTNSDFIVHIHSSGSNIVILDSIFNQSQITITYVHEFQHALRMIGMNDFADNFKV